MKKNDIKSFAERAKEIQKIFEGRDDAISRATMLHRLGKLKDEQEAAKVLMEEAKSKRESNKQFVYGGPLDPDYQINPEYITGYNIDLQPRNYS